MIVYALSNTGISSALFYLKKIEEAKKLTFFVYELDDHMNLQYDIGVFDGIKNFKNYVKKYESNILAALVLGPPLELSSIEPIRYLDSFPNDSETSFSLKEAKWDKLISSVIRLKTEKAVIKNIVFKNPINIIDRILEKQENFLNHLLSFIMTIKHANRKPMQRLLVKFLFGDIKKRFFLKKISDYLPTRGKGVTYYHMLIKKLEEPYAQKLISCLRKFKKEKDFNLIIEQGVSSYEVLYLCSIYNETVKKTFDVSKLKELSLMFPNSSYEDIQ